MLNLFHEYQHGEISRRDFLDRAAKFAVGGLTVTAIWESLRPNYAWAQQVPKDDMRITTYYETVPSPDGNGSIKGYLRAPGQSRRQAAGRARHPREPRAEPLHRGRGAPIGGPRLHRLRAGRPHVGRRLSGRRREGAAAFRTVNGPKMVEDFVASAKWLKARPESSGKLGAVGFCFGGGIVNQLAVRLPDLDAGAPFYGRQPSADGRAEDQGVAPAALRRHNDTGINAGIPAYEAALKANSKAYELYVYEGTQHGFHNDTTPRYDERRRSSRGSGRLDFFNQNVRG